jgi:hypothetical protein
MEQLSAPAAVPRPRSFQFDGGHWQPFARLVATRHPKNRFDGNGLIAMRAVGKLFLSRVHV